ncbi:MAG TPA: hypothetical protein VFE47_00310 [Tepidisphaeraceae bacterium]|nr:hypothetical protein [Tepidisphaeraceae bacterium]
MEHDGNWYVQVEPDVLEISSVKYTDRLLKVEAEIERAEGLRVMLLSMLPMGCELEFEMPVLWALHESCRNRDGSELMTGK